MIQLDILRMSSLIKKPNTICVLCNVLLNDKKMVKNRKKCIKNM